MTTETVIELGRKVMENTLWLVTPILLVAMVVSLVINIVQVLTSVQEATISTVPRLLTTAVAAFLLMPWMVRRAAVFMVEMFSDFHRYAR